MTDTPPTRPGDTIDVTTDDGRTFTGTVVETTTDYITTDGGEGTHKADVIAFTRDDGHRMKVYAHADATDLYTSRNARGSGTKAIVANGVGVDVTPGEDTHFDDPEGFDLSAVEVGDRVEFKTADGKTRSHLAVDVVVNPNGHGRRIVAFDEDEYDETHKRSRRLSSWGAADAKLYADGDLSEPGFESHPVTGIRFVTPTDPADASDS